MTNGFTQSIRIALAESGQTLRELSVRTDINIAALYRFRSGERGLSLDNLDRLADVLGLSVSHTSLRDGSSSSPRPMSEGAQ